MSLKRRSPKSQTEEEWGKWAVAHRQKMASKYGTAESERRSTGTNLFFGSLAIGTPPVSYNVILDTGSSDLWVADSSCNSSCDGVATFNPNASTTFKTENTPFSISYGSGKASGFLGSDTVQMAGFSVSNQTFALCDTVSDGLLTSPVSGLLGLAFKSIASSGATPFWQALAENDAWDQPLMAFHLTRFLNNSQSQTLEFGGSLDLGFVNQSLYTGDIEYLDLATTESYWILPLTTLSTNGQSISIPSGSDSYAAIDTGTTLVGGPSEYLREFYAQIPGANPGTGNFQGYYTYPCDTTVDASMSFGGKTWPISEADFRLTQLSQNLCLGAFFDLTTGRSAPAWIVGDTFLVRPFLPRSSAALFDDDAQKNVYSVYRYDPPSVGFAELSSTALAMNSADTPVPSATIGSVAATVVATGGFSTFSNSGALPLYTPTLQLLLVLGGVLTVVVASGLCI
ncbi:hypothetical protein DXG01_007006 [Tephrocybe rancida]|nr:hypothetical protein DXG01_007006 [Tephrocybe rancida]